MAKGSRCRIRSECFAQKKVPVSIYLVNGIKPQGQIDFRPIRRVVAQ
jgi:hypothetical protein